MSENAKPETKSEAQDNDAESVGSMELFFDLVFVYAMSQVTELMLTDLSWRGFGRGALALLAVWWAWVCYAWLTNTVTPARVASQCLIIAAMAAMLLAASALLTAFSTGALVFGLALVAVRVIHLAMFEVAAFHCDEELRSGLLRLTPSLLAGPVLIAVAAAFPSPYRELLWIVAALVDFGGPLVAGVGGFRVVPSYFVERHGNIIIIVLGEAIVGLGAGAAKHLHQPAVLAAAVLGILIAASLWWTYFGLTGGAEKRLRKAHGSERAQLARDAYSYVLPLTGYASVPDERRIARFVFVDSPWVDLQEGPKNTGKALIRHTYGRKLVKDELEASNQRAAVQRSLETFQRDWDPNRLLRIHQEGNRVSIRLGDATEPYVPFIRLSVSVDDLADLCRLLAENYARWLKGLQPTDLEDGRRNPLRLAGHQLDLT